MNRKELLEEIKRFQEREDLLKSLVPGQLIYEMELADPFGESYFKHEVVSIDWDEQCVITKDLSLDGKPSRLYCFDLGKDIGLPDFETVKKENI